MPRSASATGGSGLRGGQRDHGWPPIPPSPPPTPPACRGANRGVVSPEAARVGGASGVSEAASYRSVRRGACGRPGCAGGPRGALRRQGHDRRAALWLWPSAKAIKIGDDKGDISATPS
jgi:hypothetical protein